MTCRLWRCLQKWKEWAWAKTAKFRNNFLTSLHRQWKRPLRPHQKKCQPTSLQLRSLLRKLLPQSSHLLTLQQSSLLQKWKAATNLLSDVVIMNLD